MIRKFFILLLTMLVMGLYFVSFDHQAIQIPLYQSKYEINMDIPLKVISVITAIGSIFFICFGFKKIMSSLFWPLLLVAITITSCSLAWKHAFGIHSGGWGWSITLSIICTLFAVLYGIDKANISMDPSYGLPE